MRLPVEELLDLILAENNLKSSFFKDEFGEECKNEQQVCKG